MGVRDTIAKAVMGIKAYHGSPHSFDRFDASKIGTGEGAQSYGHGLYFAGNPNIAHGYAEKLGTPTIGGVPFNADIPQHYLTEALGGQLMGSNPAEIRSKWLNMISKDVEDMRRTNRPADAKQIEKFTEMERILRSGEPVPAFDPMPGHRYEVNIKADPSHLLDWDKPLREQPIVGQIPPKWLDDARREAQSRAYAATTRKRSDELWGMAKDPTNAPGEFLVSSRKYYEAPELSASLNEAGIPGIKYLDAGSRSAGEGSSNYVIFPGSVDKIDILKKYGVAAMPTGAIAADQMGSTFDQRYYGEQP